ncbi:MAG: hypothetical protein ACXWI6_18800, partial [Burkholderiales bacterium]
GFRTVQIDRFDRERRTRFVRDSGFYFHVRLLMQMMNDECGMMNWQSALYRKLIHERTSLEHLDLAHAFQASFIINHSSFIIHR